MTTCNEIRDTTKSILTKTVPTKSNVIQKNFNILLPFLLITTVLLIFFNINCYLIKLFIALLRHKWQNESSFILINIYMESYDKLKENNIKSCKYYYFNDIIKIEEFDLEKSYENKLVYNISYKTLTGAKQLHIKFSKVDEFVRVTMKLDI